MTPSPLVGRGSQIALIDGALRHLTEGRGAAIHFVGEPGIGKTALLSCAQQRATGDVIVRTASADDSDQRRRLACAMQLLPSASVGATGDPIGAALAAIDELCATRPLLLLADDVQWADAASLDVLAAIARRAEVMGVMLLSTARTHPRSVDLARFETAIDRSGQRVALETLVVDEVADLVEATLGARPEPVLAGLLAGASGNPFLTVELLRALHRDDSLRLVDGSLHLAPGRLLPAALADRLAREAIAASHNDSLLIRAAAVIPGGFMAEELAGIVGRPLVNVVSDLLDLSDAEVLSERHGRLGFRHDIIRQAIVDATPTPVVRSLNRQAVAVLTAANADPARVANCLLVAADPNDAHDLAALLDLGMALRDDSPYAAADLLSAVHTTLQRGDPRDPRRVDVAMALGWTMIDRGQLTDINELLDGLGELAVNRLDVRRLRGHSLNLRGELTTDFPPLPDDFDLDAACLSIDGEAVAVLAELSILEILCGRLDQAAELVRWVRGHGVDKAPEAELYLCEAQALLHGRDGSFDEGVAVAERAVQIAHAHPTREASRSRPVVVAATMLDAMGRGDEALSMLRAAHTEPGPKWNVPLLQFCAAITLYRRGEWDDALAELSAGLTSAEEFDVRLGSSWPHAINVLVHTARGDPAAAKAWLQRSEEAVQGNSIGMEWLLYAKAMYAEAHGDPTRALDTLRPVVDICIGVGAPAVLMNLSPDTARLAAVAGDQRTLRTVTDSLSAIAANTSSPVVHAFELWAGAWRTGDHRSAERAATLMEGCGRRAESARSTHDAAVLAAAAGEFEAARGLAGVAFEAYEQLRAEQLHARLRAELRVHGLSMRPRRAPPRPVSGWDSLTVTERRVVELVGDGMTNGQIAEQLFVSRRTIESHLARVYQKLDSTRRAELVVAERTRREGAPRP